MRAILLAGGKGTRLYPYTAFFPKPLVPVGDRPILEILIRQLKYSGFSHITLCVGYLAALLRSYFNDGKSFGVKIDYSFEEKPLGTVAPIRLIKDLPRTFLVANGDLLTDVNFKKMLIRHKKEKAKLTVGVYKRHQKVDLGVLDIKDGEIVSYNEKPENDLLVSAGVYIFDKSILDYVPRNKYFDFPSLVNKLIENKVKILAYEIDGYWLDIGRPDDYQIAIEKYTSNPKLFLKGLHAK